MSSNVYEIYKVNMHTDVNHHLRVARPVSNLARAAHMYCQALQMRVLTSFQDHAGFDGIIVGNPGAGYHFEFTFCRDHPIAPSATVEDLTIFYIASERAWEEACARMTATGFRQVPAFNPYWEVRGRTYADPDGYRVVLQQSEWG